MYAIVVILRFLLIKSSIRHPSLSYFSRGKVLIVKAVSRHDNSETTHATIRPATWHACAGLTLHSLTWESQICMTHVCLHDYSGTSHAGSMHSCVSDSCALPRQPVEYYIKGLAVYHLQLVFYRWTLFNDSYVCALGRTVLESNKCTWHIPFRWARHLCVHVWFTSTCLRSYIHS